MSEKLQTEIDEIVTDFIRRAQEHGYTLRYEPSAVIYHRESGASGGGWMTGSRRSSGWPP